MPAAQLDPNTASLPTATRNPVAAPAAPVQRQRTPRRAADSACSPSFRAALHRCALRPVAICGNDVLIVVPACPRVPPTCASRACRRTSRWPIQEW